MLSDTSPELLVIYDLSDDSTWERARLHRDEWGKLYTDVYTLDTDRIILAFRPGGERWQEWEKVRLQKILEAVA